MKLQSSSCSIPMIGDATLACDMVFWMDSGMLRFRSLYTAYCLCNFLLVRLLSACLQ